MDPLKNKHFFKDSNLYLLDHISIGNVQVNRKLGVKYNIIKHSQWEKKSVSTEDTSRFNNDTCSGCKAATFCQRLRFEHTVIYYVYDLFAINLATSNADSVCEVRITMQSQMQHK